MPTYNCYSTLPIAYKSKKNQQKSGEMMLTQIAIRLGTSNNKYNIDRYNKLVPEMCVKYDKFTGSSDRFFF